MLLGSLPGGIDSEREKTMRVLWFLILTPLLMTLPGCAFHSYPDPLRGSQGVVPPELPADSWPARSTDLLPDFDSLTPGKLTLLMPVRIMHPGDHETKDFRMQATVLHHGVYGRGLLR